MDLERFFERAVRRSFADLALGDAGLAAYLTDLLVRFARSEALYPRGASVPRLEGMTDVLLEIEAAWDLERGAFAPEREVRLRQHLGDYALFMTGLFPRRVAQGAGVRAYVAEGARAYRFVAEHLSVSSAASQAVSSAASQAVSSAASQAVGSAASQAVSSGASPAVSPAASQAVGSAASWAGSRAPRRGPDATIFRRLSDRFEFLAGALDYSRRVHFRETPGHRFFSLGFG